MAHKDYLIIGAVFGGFAAWGAATTIALEKGVTKFGHVFQHYNYQPEFGVKSAALLGLIGAVNALASIIATVIVSEDGESKPKSLGKAIVCSIATGITLAALTALAAKTNLIASQLTLFGGIMLITNSAVTNMLLIYLTSD